METLGDKGHFFNWLEFDRNEKHKSTFNTNYGNSNMLNLFGRAGVQLIKQLIVLVLKRGSIDSHR